MKITFNLKEPNKAESLILLFCRWNGNLVKWSTRHRIECKTWNKDKQQCLISKSRFSAKTNSVCAKTNKFINALKDLLCLYFESEDFNEETTALSSVRETLEHLIDTLVGAEKVGADSLRQTPIDFFKKYVEQKRIDPHTGRYIAERTKIHQRTVIHRLESFLNDTHLPNDFSTFTSKKFDSQFTEWCYSNKNYKQNTVYATYGVLKPLLNAAKEEGFTIAETYKTLKGKCNDVDAVYLNEEEINRIYHLDIPKLIEEGEIDAKSTIEETRDLFVIGCWTGLRRSDLSRLNKASFDIIHKTITVTAEKTKRQVIIPMHPFVLELWQKYNGKFPSLRDKHRANIHIRECARHAQIEDEVRIIENRGGKVSTLVYKKYQLVGMHTGRRSFATNMYKRRFPTIAIMKLTGHTTESNFLKYIKVTPEENAAMMADEFFKCQNPF